MKQGEYSYFVSFRYPRASWGSTSLMQFWCFDRWLFWEWIWAWLFLLGCRLVTRSPGLEFLHSCQILAQPMLNHWDSMLLMEVSGTMAVYMYILYISRLRISPQSQSLPFYLSFSLLRISWHHWRRLSIDNERLRRRTGQRNSGQ